MRSKKVFAIILFVLAGVVLVLGIIQLALFLPPQLAMLNDARMQGAADEQQISEYVRQTLMPQVLLYVMLAFGFCATLSGIGLISLQLGAKAFGTPQPQDDSDAVQLEQPDEEKTASAKIEAKVASDKVEEGKAASAKAEEEKAASDKADKAKDSSEDSKKAKDEDKHQEADAEEKASKKKSKKASVQV